MKATRHTTGGTLRITSDEHAALLRELDLLHESNTLIKHGSLDTLRTTLMVNDADATIPTDDNRTNYGAF